MARWMEFGSEPQTRVVLFFFALCSSVNAVSVSVSVPAGRLRCSWPK